MSQIPTTRDLIQLLNDGKLTPSGFLDILEKKLKDESEVFSSDDLYDLYRSGRITKEEYISHERGPDTHSEAISLNKTESLSEQYNHIWGEETK